MASSAFDLNHWNESDALAKSAVSYASLAGHSSLQAWTVGLAALLANWRCEPDIALSHYQHGMHLAPPGEPRARLRYIASRSYALLGDNASVADVLASARRDQDDADRHPDSLSEEVGGEFAFGRARAAACAAAAWLDLGDGHEASVAAQSALAELTALPGPRRPLSQIDGARIDLATACLLNNDLDASARPSSQCSHNRLQSATCPWRADWSGHRRHCSSVPGPGTAEPASSPTRSATGSTPDT